MANFEAFHWNFLSSTNPQIVRSDILHSDDIAQIEPNFKPKFLHLDCLHLSHLRLLLLRTLFLASAHALALTSTAAAAAESQAHGHIHHGH